MKSMIHRQNSAPKKQTFLCSLRSNVAGNVLVMAAAAVVPTIGLIGAGVDVSRMYLTRTRLQGACDAATLMGRKVMATGKWDANNNAALAAANQAFTANFNDGAYGTSNLTKSFSESASVVSGTARVDVPMTLTRVLGNETTEVAVTCNAELTIPNTDVMFVLDTTGSMSWTDTDDTQSRISGLRIAVKCFYEALAKENIDDVTPQQCKETKDPSGGNYSTVQLRFGFVPYSVNVNVGKLLPLDVMATNWTYQSRQPISKDTLVSTPIYGTEGPLVQSGTPTTNNPNPDWTNVPPSRRVTSLSSYVESYVTINRIEYSINRYRRDNNNRPNSQGECDTGLSPRPSNETGGSPGSLVLVSQTTPVYPATTVTKTYTRTDSTSGIEYRYKYLGHNEGWDEGDGGYAVSGDTNSAWQVQGGYRFLSNNWQWRNGYLAPRHCRLQSKSLSGTTTTTFTTTTPITWDFVKEFDRWSYQPVTFNVSALKRNDIWNDTLPLPLGDKGTLRDVAWGGCIEERKTVRFTGTDATGQWNTVPTDAWDMKIDDLPTANDDTTKWGPMLQSAVYLRSDNNGYTRNHVETTNDFPNNTRYYCPSEAKTLQTWTATNFKDYLNNLIVDGNTYHDIGLLWGARLASPEGLFKATVAQPSKKIERHMIFMTDGDTTTYPYDMSAYGTAWWDRRQTPDDTVPTSDTLDSVVDERTKAICTAIKNKNITLWVIAFGKTVSENTKTRLTACASPGRYFAAADTALLLERFKAMAADISQLRLTQ